LKNLFQETSGIVSAFFHRTFIFGCINEYKVKHPIFIILEFLAGFVFAVLGGYAFSFFDRYNSLDTSIALAFTSAFIALLVGVGVIGYLHLKKVGRVKYF
jgi:hypothetical protein